MRKTDKYQDLHKEMSLCGFNVTLKTIEVGSRGVFRGVARHVSRLPGNPPRGGRNL